MTEFEQIKDSTKSEPSECSCNTCKDMCHTSPCMGTPADILRLINNGLAHALVPTQYAAGRSRGVPDIYTVQLKFEDGQCVLLNEEGLCSIHELGIKPTEGVLSSCEGGPAPGALFFLPDAVAATWNLGRNARTVNQIIYALDKLKLIEWKK